MDEFDNNPSTTHIVLTRTDKNCRICGYLRVLSSEGPHQLSNTWPVLCSGERPSGPHIAEVSRFCVSPVAGEREKKPIVISLVLELISWARRNDVSQFIVETSPAGVALLRRLHFRIANLGPPCFIEGVETCAILMTFDYKTIAHFEGLRRLTHPTKEIGETG